ncbi:asparagine synthase (glutamine-hydrolyzing) [Alcaligenaceae bacterium]|nr:asparagine synthase (glutamine-hydrolyzing) [Alcaligenaceae bacterium]
MSGITGIISASSDTASQTTLQAMTDSLAHRGPDGEGHFITSHFVLGYRNFDVYGLVPDQAQAMLHLDRYAVAIDGRIYNMPELQDELRDYGYEFDSASDGLLLAAAYDKWGVDCLHKLNADWAFVLYDTQTAQYFISRDRFGLRPLYYYTDPEKFIFGSEVKAIYASRLVAKVPNETYLQTYLEKGPNEYDSPTAFAGVLRFPFAHYFLGTHEQLLSAPQFTRYWDLQVNVAREKFCPAKAKDYAKQYYDLFADAVRVRMRGNVQVGAALSGGLDSSSIVYLMNEELKKQGSSERLQTFSSVYKTPGTEHCDESEFIKLVVDELDVASNQIEPDVKAIPAEHVKMIWAMENPPESTCMSGWHTFMKAKQCGVKVVLEGQGADEQLAGYFSYIPAYLMSLSLIDFYKEFFKFMSIPGARKQTLASFLMLHYRAVFGESIYRATFEKIKKRSAIEELNKELKNSIEHGLVTLMHYSDHVSTGHSIESRMPFMDYRLVQYLATVPASYKLHNGWTKYLARQTFSGKLPHGICWRKDKMGWPIPEEHWFNGEHKDWIEKQLLSSELLTQLELLEETRRMFTQNLDKTTVLKLVRRLNMTKVFSS